MKTADTDQRTALCPSCEQDSLCMTLEEETFQYGTGEAAVELRARVPVYTCAACDFQFTDHEAERIRHETVCRHLGVLNSPTTSTMNLDDLHRPEPNPGAYSPPAQWQRQIIDQRLADLEANPETGTSWEKVERRLWPEA